MATYLSGYQLMWILVMFDLPTDSRETRKKATKFRQFLLDEGFVMSQYSNYLRFSKSKEQSESYIRRIEKNLPERGKINILMFTDKQYENIISFSGNTRNPAAKNPGQLALF